MAFAASDVHAANRNGWDPLSTEWAYYHALKRDGGQPDDGVTLNNMMATIKSDGQPVEAEWPYIKAPIADVKSWKPPALSKKKLFYRDHEACSVSVPERHRQAQLQCASADHDDAFGRILSSRR